MTGSSSATKKQIPIGEGLFDWPSKEPRLAGNQCKSCSTYYFPKSFRCHDPECMGTEMEDIQCASSAFKAQSDKGHFS
jgi:uncharacterized OB-fold protein